MNRTAGVNASSSLSKSAKLRRHNPYASRLLAPEDSVEFNNSILNSPLSARHSPLNWEARAFDPTFMYSRISTPYIGQSFSSLNSDAQVRRSLFGDSPAALAVNHCAEAPAVEHSSNNIHISVNVAPTPVKSAGAARKAIGKIYVGGRPVVVPRYDNEVSVQLRSGETTFVIHDIYSLLVLEEETRDLVGLSVMVEGDRGEDLGVVTALLKAESATAPATPSKTEAEEKDKASSHSAKSLPRVLRVASSAELQQNEALPQLEAEALAYCHACLAEVQLAVPIAVEGVFFQFDRKKLTVRYTSDAYVDFNDVTRLLHKKFNCRIWMDQLNREVVSSTEKRSRRAEHGGKKSGGGNQRRNAQKRNDS
ncbi:hypothetical protein ABB37_08065 [Leptomonas pyrrhocoris]|uniref:PSP1 C-terminal domain-containing protein n=1 Tax=Leptomonas pyrrhocoris TaxID=157538 RepID=A0A0N1J4E8_LEPPY|nr:hypothetical protein ABB37_08065 [Leptomonas pyrrhocoris]XP_015654321.1 hypothetical protein ABB37_08065 [Leptomonas pyrrhocoris]KPA75881.1 hypothetical protein ABB37_08065 [Leptomonas pyrrhocoris]KPA75882.1 hypothetical protein ABB37_08065 [Leptomonas pyrrhocoris]|eukprot:XP_015654320.1 hypothetical protein ABB37_08065 [Leptomonas pyrrhocoris]